MSIANDCREAALTLLEDPGLKTYGIPRVFTELDVIFLAARNGGGYSPEEMQIARRDASQTMGDFFRSRQVARYGPVSLEPLGLKRQDYARIATKIIYGHPKHAPDELRTPNGIFPRMMWEQDLIKQPGRRLGANRSDIDPWSEQGIMHVGPRRPQSASPEQREITRLTAENEALHHRLIEVEGENNRLREQLVVAPSRLEVQDMVASLEGRLDELERNGLQRD